MRLDFFYRPISVYANITWYSDHGDDLSICFKGRYLVLNLSRYAIRLNVVFDVNYCANGITKYGWIVYFVLFYNIKLEGDYKGFGHLNWAKVKKLKNYLDLMVSLYLYYRSTYSGFRFGSVGQKCYVTWSMDLWIVYRVYLVLWKFMYWFFLVAVEKYWETQLVNIGYKLYLYYI